MAQCPYEARIPIIRAFDMSASCILQEGHEGPHQPAEQYRQVIEAFLGPGNTGLSKWVDRAAPPEPPEPELSSRGSKDAIAKIAHVLLRLAGWNKQVVFHYPIMVSMTEQEQQAAANACLGYILRRLSRGAIPNPKLVMDTLEGKSPVPPCGFLGCDMADDHTH